MIRFRLSTQAAQVRSATSVASRGTSSARSRVHRRIADFLISAALTVGAAMVPITWARAAPPAHSTDLTNVTFGTVKIENNLEYISPAIQRFYFDKVAPTKTVGMK